MERPVQRSLPGTERRRHVGDVSRVLMQLSWVAQKQTAFSVAQHALTVPQFLTLTVLIRSRHAYSMNQLAEATHQDAATMTGVIDRLERLGLVERARSREDRRMVLVGPTPQGVAVVQNVKRSRDEMLMHLFAPLSDEALMQLSQHLEQLWQLLEAQARQGYDCDH